MRKVHGFQKYSQIWNFLWILRIQKKFVDLEKVWEFKQITNLKKIAGFKKVHKFVKSLWVP